MPATVQAPVSMMESLADLRLPPIADQPLQSLMDLNTNGQLDEDERAELAALVQWSEEISLLRAGAMHLLGRTPQWR